MNRLLKAVVAGTLLGLCSAAPAPDGTTSDATVTDLPTYVDTVQSIECLDGGKIRLSFQNQYSFMDAWDWGCMISRRGKADSSTAGGSHQWRR